MQNGDNFAKVALEITRNIEGRPSHQLDLAPRDICRKKVKEKNVWNKIPLIMPVMFEDNRMFSIPKPCKELDSLGLVDCVVCQENFGKYTKGVYIP